MKGKNSGYATNKGGYIKAPKPVTKDERHTPSGLPASVTVAYEVGLI